MANASTGDLVCQGGTGCDELSRLYKSYAENKCDFDKELDEAGKPIDQQVCSPTGRLLVRNADFALGYLAAVRDQRHMPDAAYDKLTLKVAQLENQNQQVLDFCDKNPEADLLDYIKSLL